MTDAQLAELLGSYDLRVVALERQVKELTAYINTLVRTQAEQNEFNQRVMLKLSLDTETVQ